MTRASPLFANCHSSQVNNSTGQSGMSQGKFSAREKRRAKQKYRADFAAKWQRFILDEFDCPATAAHEFGCDPSTAEGWFEGRHAPSGPFVGYAYARWPERAFAYLAEIVA